MRLNHRPGWKRVGPSPSKLEDELSSGEDLSSSRRTDNWAISASFSLGSQFTFKSLFLK